MQSKIITLLVVALVASFAFSATDASAGSLTQQARNDAQQAHRTAAYRGNLAISSMAENASREANFKAALAGSSVAGKTAARLAYIDYLRRVRRTITTAYVAHGNAIKAYERYAKISQNWNAAIGNINALKAAMSGYIATRAAIATKIKYLPTS